MKRNAEAEYAKQVLLAMVEGLSGQVSRITPENDARAACDLSWALHQQLRARGWMDGWVDYPDEPNIVEATDEEVMEGIDDVLATEDPPEPIFDAHGIAIVY